MLQNRSDHSFCSFDMLARTSQLFVGVLINCSVIWVVSCVLSKQTFEQSNDPLEWSLTTRIVTLGTIHVYRT